MIPGTNLFIVGTSSQVLNALELIHFYSLGNEQNLFVITSPSPLTRREISNIVYTFESKQVISLFKCRRERTSKFFRKGIGNLIRLYISRIKFDNLITNLRVKRLVIGNYSSYISLYAIQKIKSEPYILDDGNGTTILQKFRKQELESGIPSYNYYMKLDLLWLIKLIFRFKEYQIADRLIFFTNYEIEVHKNDVKIHNNNLLLKQSLFRKDVDKEMAFFIGSPISETGYIKAKDEIDLIRETQKKFSKLTFTYIPHRLDNPAKLKKISKFMRINRLFMPVEYYLGMSKLKSPGACFGFFSSALQNISLLTAGHILVFSVKIPKHLIYENTHSERAGMVYDTYEMNRNIAVIDVQN